LRQSQKMEAIGRLTGGIAHDFNNLLTIIRGSLELVQRRTRDMEPREARLIGTAVEGADRASKLTHRLLAFSRQQPLEPRTLDVNRLVGGMSELLRRTLGERIEIETVLTGGLWPILADPNQLENALINLAVNARDAMEDGGRMTIETANAHLDEAYAAAETEVKPGQYVMIAVSDTGTGMTPEVIAKAFEPFFTTKEAGAGTGLGLSQVFGFVKQSGGHIKIYSERDRGTVLKMYFPRNVAALPEDVGPIEGPEIDPRGGGDLIVVVEDEPAVRQYTVDALRDLGYEALEAPDAQTALRLLDHNPGIRLLLTDVVMPGMDGRRLSEAALAKHPNLKVLFMTGYTRNAIIHNGTLDAGVNLLTKPFSLARLAAKVREVLDGPAS
jgi:CheY-like chemotaxis protein